MIHTLLTVADLHRSKALFNELKQAVALHRPTIVAFVGDFLHAGDDNKGRLTVAECAQNIAALDCSDVIFVRGNHEDDDWLVFASEWKKSGRPLHALHGEAYMHGAMTIVGFPCLMGDESAYIGERLPLPIESEEWLPELIHPIGSAARTIWLMHEPPAGTPLSASGTVVEGNPDWVWAIERFSPWLTISGHDHQTPIRKKLWHHRIGRTLCINVGQTDHGPLRYCFIEAEFTNDTPSLPVQMRVTAFPMGKTIALPF